MRRRSCSSWRRCARWWHGSRAGCSSSGQLDRHEAIFLWLALAGLLILARAGSRAISLRIAPAERCLFIGDELSAETIRSKLAGHGGIKAEIVAQLDLDKASPWSTDSYSEAAPGGDP